MCHRAQLCARCQRGLWGQAGLRATWKESQARRETEVQVEGRSRIGVHFIWAQAGQPVK